MRQECKERRAAHATRWPLLGLAISFPVLTSCATYSALHGANVPPQKLLLSEVVYLVPRSQLLQQSPWGYKSLLASGVQDAEIKDGSVAWGRVYCCGGKTDEAFAFAFHVPSEIRVQRGDLVEVRSGPATRSGEVSTPVNTVTRLVDKSACRWDPPDPRQLKRVLYCEWMEKEGWKRYKGSGTEANVWIKEP